jgi:ABC-type lipoprotein export system ATPase subunit
MQMVVEVKDGYVQVSGKALFDALNFTVRSGEMACLNGPSGCGKTFLLKTILGFCRLDSGYVSIDGTLVTASSAPTLRRMIAYVAQDFKGVVPLSQSDEEQLKPEGFSVMSSNCWTTEAERRQKLEEHPQKPVPTSAETFQMIKETLLAEGKQIILVDDPTAGLTDEHVAAVLLLLRQQAEAGKPVLVASCDSRVAAVCDKLINFNERKEAE